MNIKDIRIISQVLGLLVHRAGGKVEVSHTELDELRGLTDALAIQGGPDGYTIESTQCPCAECVAGRPKEAASKTLRKTAEMLDGIAEAHFTKKLDALDGAEKDKLKEIVSGMFQAITANPSE